MALVLAPISAGAASYGDISGTDVDFINVNEQTASPGDPDGLFGGVLGPVVSGNQLLFFPTEFSASAVGDSPSADLTSALLNVTIQSTNDAFFINELNVTEFGNVDLSGAGDASASVSLTGLLTVLDVDFAPIVPVVIPFSGVFSPNADGGFELPGDSGSQLWNGGFSIDIAAELLANGQDPFATRVVLQLDNTLDASSELGTTALIQKNVVDGPAVTLQVIPEPGTALLLGLGLAGLAAGRRSSARGRRPRALETLEN